MFLRPEGVPTGRRVRILRAEERQGETCLEGRTVPGPIYRKAGVLSPFGVPRLFLSGNDLLSVAWSLAPDGSHVFGSEPGEKIP